VYTTVEYEVWRAAGRDDVWHVYLWDELLGTIHRNEHGFFQVDKDEEKYLWPKFDLALFWTIRCASVVLSTAAYRRAHGKDDNELMQIGEL
jgi:hypothetical protein